MKKIIHIWFLFVVVSTLKAQDIHFSQFRETPMLINPAQTCLNKHIRVILNYKDQWRSVASPYKTFAFSAEYAINHKKDKPSYLAIGAQLFNDVAGDAQMKTTSGMLSLNGVLKIAEKQKLSMGIMGGIGQKSINYDKLKWGSQYDGYAYNPSITANSAIAGVNSFVYPDVGAGIAWSYGKGEKYITANDGIKAVMGVSAFHFGIPQYSYYKNTSEKLNTKLTAHGAVEIGIPNKDLIIIPELFTSRQGKLSEFNMGVMFKYIVQEGSKFTGIKKSSAFSLGIHNRFKDAIIGTVLYEYSFYAIGVSYDVNISKLNASSNMRGGFEIALRFVTPNQFPKTKARF